jgi:hypothetical protein
VDTRGLPRQPLTLSRSRPGRSGPSR